MLSILYVSYQLDKSNVLYLATKFFKDQYKVPINDFISLAVLLIVIVSPIVAPILFFLLLKYN